MTDLLNALRVCLADTELAAPRPVAPMKLPPAIARQISRQLNRHLSAAAVLVPIVDRPEPTLLLTRRSDDLKSHSGQVSFPGGRQEPADRDLAETALREASEEVGITPQDVEIIGYLDDYPTITGFMVTPVVARIPPDMVITPDASEVADVFEVPLEILLRRESYERRIYRKLGVPAPYFRVQYDGYTIWGATAGMLINMVEKFEMTS